MKTKTKLKIIKSSNHRIIKLFNLLFIFHSSLFIPCGAQSLFYGMTSAGGKGNAGTIISFNPSTNKDSVGWSFLSSPYGEFPYGNLVWYPNNSMYYGMMYGGGTNNEGVIFSFNPSSKVETALWNFGGGSDGAEPYGSLVWDAKNSLFYGMTNVGGGNGLGTIISFNPATNIETVVWSFGSGSDGKYPDGDMVWDPIDSIFFSMTNGGGSHGGGAIISFSPSNNNESVVWSFGSGSDGLNPSGDLVWDAGDSLFYGLTVGGGNNTEGTIFNFNPSNSTESVLWSFGSGNDGINPYGKLLWDAADSLFYGTSAGGGSISVGTIFSFNPFTGNESVVWNFGTNTNDGNYPYGDLVWDSTNSTLYGMTYGGGNNLNYGTIFSFNPTNNNEAVVWSFGSGPDGANPSGDLMWDAANSLFYGMTELGGINSDGILLTFNPSNNSEAVVYSFGSGSAGNTPQGNLVWDASNSLFYGMTPDGGSGGAGTLFNYNASNDSKTVVWNFGSGADGKNPYGNLVWDATNSQYYGMTEEGGTNNLGTIFTFNPSNNSESVVWNLGSGSDGASPDGDMIWDASTSLFYGMTANGGTNGLGSIFSFNPSTNVESVVWSFGSGTDGAYPYGDLVWDASNSLFYGMTNSGGSNTYYGTIFSFKPSKNMESVVWSFGTGNDGANPYGDLVWDSTNAMYYGMTSSGGANGEGAIISFKPSNASETVPWSFGTGLDGTAPEGNLIWDAINSIYYGMTSAGGSNAEGTIISFNPTNNNESVVWNFGNGTNDGSTPYGSLTMKQKPTGIKQLIPDNKETLTVFPDPSNGRFTIQSSVVSLPYGSQGCQLSGRELEIEIYNDLGLIVYSTEFSSLNIQFSIDLSNQPSGVYFYRVIGENGGIVENGKLEIAK